MLKTITERPRIHLNITSFVHAPTLKTVLMVEETLRNQDGPVSMAGLKRALPKKVMDQSLRLILSYLENKGSIVIGKKGISWIENSNPKFLEMIRKAKVIDA